MCEVIKDLLLSEGDHFEFSRRDVVEVECPTEVAATMSTYYIFRTTGGRGFEEGPRSTPPPEIANEVKLRDLSRVRQTVLRYDDDQATNWIVGELFEHGRLRQGWGVPGLDLKPTVSNAGKAKWISTYIESAWRYWGTRADVSSAYGRLQILTLMYNLQPYVDVLFIPNVSDAGWNPDCFLVATVAGRYWFENRNAEPDTWRKDFGHVVPVTKLKTYRRSDYPLDFGAPYLKAVNHIERTHNRYRAFRQFGERVYRRD